MTKAKRLILLCGIIIFALLIFLWRPTILIYGIQRAGLYAAIALPMALVLGIVHIVNLAHGEFLMVGAYLTYFVSVTFGLDPLVALLPVAAVMYLLGMVVYKITIKHTLKAPELNQLILTFGLAMVLGQSVNLIATSQPRTLTVDYVSTSLTLGQLTFGVYDFIFPATALIILGGLLFFLRKTRMGKAAQAVGQNPRGAEIVGIDVDKIYLIIFSLSTALVGIMGSLYLTKQSIFPLVGGPFTMKSFALVAMAGIGSLPGVLIASIILGVAETFLLSFKGYGGWSNIVFFAFIIIVILLRSHKGKQI